MKNNHLVNFEIYPLEQNYVDGIKNLEDEQNISILSKKAILDDLYDENSKYYIATLDNKLVGYVGCTTCLDYMDILSIVVKKDYQHIGIGSRLLEHIINIAKQEGIKEIFLEVRISNQNAISLYEKYGFKNINTREKYYPDNHEDAYVYKLDI